MTAHRSGGGYLRAVSHLTRRQIGDLLARYQISPSKAWGQNFVADPNTVARIARLAEVGPGDRVVEVGAGLGSLTLALADTGARVVAVEVDPRLVAALHEVVEGTDVEIVEGDALHLDWPRVLGDARGTWALVANLPYNVATPLLMSLLAGVPAIDRMLVMVQREVGERLAAGAGDDAYGAVSAKVAYWATAKVAGRVPPTVFLPQPKVESVLVRLVRRPSPAVAGDESDRQWLFHLIETAFNQRRKMLRRSLAGVVQTDAFAVAGIPPDARPEEVGIEAWGRLAAATKRRP